MLEVTRSEIDNIKNRYFDEKCLCIDNEILGKIIKLDRIKKLGKLCKCVNQNIIEGGLNTINDAEEEAALLNAEVYEKYDG
jgi:hypothetical protein